MDQPWEHPEWYDLHDTAHSAGAVREPEHYNEFLLALLPLGESDHLIDMGTGTGKLARLIVSGYPGLGQITLVEPNERKLALALERVKAASGASTRVHALSESLGQGELDADGEANLVTTGSVLMPVLETMGGPLSEGFEWLRASLEEIRGQLKRGGWYYAVETLALPWVQGGLEDPVRRLHFQEFVGELDRAGFDAIECMYRFRDRIVIRARR